jgi:hypothetical protein
MLCIDGYVRCMTTKHLCEMQTEATPKHSPRLSAIRKWRTVPSGNVCRNWGYLARRKEADGVNQRAAGVRRETIWLGKQDRLVNSAPRSQPAMHSSAESLRVSGSRGGIRTQHWHILGKKAAGDRRNPPATSPRSDQDSEECLIAGPLQRAAPFGKLACFLKRALSNPNTFKSFAFGIRVLPGEQQWHAKTETANRRAQRAVNRLCVARRRV